MNERSASSSRGEKGSRARLLRATLPPRTLIGFLVATAAVFVILVLSYRSLEGRSDAARRMAKTLEVTRHFEMLLSSIKDAETGQRGFLLTGSERYLAPYDAAVVALPVEFSLLRRLASDNEGQVRRLDALEPLVSGKLAELKGTIELKRSHRDEEALDIVRGDRGKEAMDAIRTAITQMKDAERLLLDTRTMEWEGAVALSTTVTWGGSLLLLALIAASALLSSRDFRDQRIEAWLASGENDLSLRMQGDQSVEALGESIATFLAGHLDALVGAVYFADTSGHLLRVGGFGLSGASVPSEAPGLTHQILRDGTAIHVKDVPDGYFEVSSALGSSKPRHLVAAPVSSDGHANGVVEFGFFHDVLDHDLELLRRVADPIGTALQSARLRRDLQRLLEETQSQAEELQTQQEELRVQNEELEQQSRALQESQARLENQQTELEQINANLEEQTQLLERQRDDLARTQTDLERASVYKSEFLANMSHELRTPLNSSLILAKLLLDNREGNMSEEQVKFAQTIYSAGNDLLSLINDILDLSKIEAGKLDVRPESVALARVVDDLRNTFEPVARDKGLELVFTVEPGPAPLYTDPARLQQILKNLLSNALKFTERGGVYLDVRREPGGRVAFEVRDTGIGIPAEQHEIIFEAFRQADGTTNRKYGGTGLGLSISRDLAKLLGGELRLHSAPGRGSSFCLLLGDYEGPRDVPRAPPPAVPLRRHVSTAPETTLPRPRPSSVPDDRDRIGPNARVILLIEDDLHFTRILCDLAHELDFQVLAADNAEDGLALAKRYRPSAVVLDVGLPDRSGLTVLDALKHDPATRHIPVHMASVEDHAQTALGMGAAGYAVKPVKREQLIEALRRLEAKFTQKLRRVLVVEDDDVHRESTCRLLQADDVETVPVGTAGEALEQLRSTTFDCMVLDLTLPDRTGFDLLEEMAQKEQYSFPPVIVYTGRSLSREQEQLLRRFSNSIIIKGARSPERLLDEVTLFLHQVESKLPPDRQRMLRDARHRESVFEGRRVLIVEDDVRNIFALSSVLEPKGAKVEIARNGREALAHLADHPGVDLVLMDIMMPEMDGLQATREIRKDPQFAKLPIIALTAKAMADDRDNCLAAGANDYVAKPVDVDKLLSLARVWMAP